MCGEQRASAELVLQASVWSEHSHQLFPANARMRVSSLFPIVYRAPPGKTLSLIAISPGGHGRGHRLALQKRAAARHEPLTVNTWAKYWVSTR